MKEKRDIKKSTIEDRLGEDVLEEKSKPQQRTIDVITLQRSDLAERELPEDATHLVRKNNDYLIKEAYSGYVIGKKWIPVQGKRVKIFSKKNGEHNIYWN